MAPFLEDTDVVATDLTSPMAPILEEKDSTTLDSPSSADWARGLSGTACSSPSHRTGNDGVHLQHESSHQGPSTSSCSSSRHCAEHAGLPTQHQISHHREPGLSASSFAQLVSHNA